MADEQGATTGGDLTQAQAQAGADQVAVDPSVSAALDEAVDLHADDDTTGADAITPPASFNDADKAMFGGLPREAQQWLADTEKRRAQQVTEATTRATNREREAASLQQRANVEAQQRYAQQLAAFVGQYQPQQPDPSRYNDMQEFARDNAIYQHQMNQYRTLVQQVQGIGNEAAQGADGLTEEARQHEARVLHAAFPEWFDEEKGAGHRERLTAIGTELGYTPELMAQAGANDIIALRKAAEWKDKSEKYDKIMSTRMAQVRRGEGSVPPNARGAAPNAQIAPKDTAAAMYPDDVRR